MAKAQDQKPVFMTETSPIIMEHHQEGDAYYYEEDVAAGGGGWGCFSFCFGSSSYRGVGERTKFLQSTAAGLDQQPAEDQYPHKETWLVVRLKSLKEFSELVAGPKWKNFIRKFSKKPRKYSTTAQYDPQSYALNFNDGVDGDEDDGFLLRSFSTRFAPPVPKPPAAGFSTDQHRRPTNL